MVLRIVSHPVKITLHARFYRDEGQGMTSVCARSSHVFTVCLPPRPSGIDHSANAQLDWLAAREQGRSLAVSVELETTLACGVKPIVA